MPAEKEKADKSSRGKLVPMRPQGGLVIDSQASMAPVSLDVIEANLSEQPPHSPPSLSHPGSSPLLRSIKRRWGLCLVVGLFFGLIGGTICWFLRPPHYTSVALINIASERQEIIPGRHLSNDQDIYRQTQAALLKSTKVIEAALTDEVRDTALLREQADPYTWLESALSVMPVRGTELLQVSLNGPNRHDLPIILNSVLDAYLKEVANREQKQRALKLKDVEKVLKESEQQLRVQRKAVEGFAQNLKANNEKTAAYREKIALDAYAALNTELIKVGSRMRDLDVDQADDPDVQNALAKALLEQELDRHADVQAQAKKIEKAEEDLAQIRRNAKPGTSRLKDAEVDLTACKEHMEEIRARLRKTLEAQSLTKAQLAAQTQAAKKKAEQRQLKRTYDSLKDEVEKCRQIADKVSKDRIVFEAERKEGEKAEKIFDLLFEQKNLLQVENMSSAKRVNVEVRATNPRTLYRKSQIMATVGGGLVFLMLGALGVAFLDKSRRRIYSRDEVVGGLGLRVLGSLPILTKKTTDSATRRLKPKQLYVAHMWTEAINGLRTVLLYEAAQRQLQVVMISSAGPLEGKSTLASQMGLSIAAAGQRTLLIDGDMRRPVLHTLFNIPGTLPGLGEVLAGTCDAAAVIRPTSKPNLWLLPAGIFQETLPELLAQGRLREALEPIKSQYDFILIDSPPIMTVNDALLMGQNVDAVLMSIRSDWSRGPEVREAYHRLRCLNIPVLGTVLNGLNMPTSDSHYRYIATSSQE